MDNENGIVQWYPILNSDHHVVAHEITFMMDKIIEFQLLLMVYVLT